MSARRIPVVATMFVAVAVTAMIALGVWQLQRRHEKAAMLALYAANTAAPVVALPALWPIDDRALYRRVSATCLSVTGWITEAGHGTDGETGWRHIARCRTGAEGPGITVDLGLSQSPDNPKEYTGGPVRGRLIWASDGQPLIARLFVAPGPKEPLIVAETPAPGLARTADPDPGTIPNNHLAYAVQWFCFAGVALVIYGVALWRRTRS